MQDPKSYERDRSQNGVDKLVDDNLPPVLNRLNWNLTRGNVLDYGCGAGSSGFRHILPKVIQTDSTLYSVDVSENMLAFAKEKYAHEKINYAVGDIYGEFPFKNLKFDKIVCCHVFNFMCDLKSALKGFKPLLKDDGQLGFICNTATTITYRVYRKLQGMERWAEYMKGYDQFYPGWSECKGDLKEHTEKIVKEAGYSVPFLEAKVVEIPIDFNKLIDIIVYANPCLLKIPEGMRKDLEEDTRKIVFELEGLPTGYGGEFLLRMDYISGVVDNNPTAAA